VFLMSFKWVALVWITAPRSVRARTLARVADGGNPVRGRPHAGRDGAKADDVLSSVLAGGRGNRRVP
jgi:hypothetical protein